MSSTSTAWTTQGNTKAGATSTSSDSLTTGTLVADTIQLNSNVIKASDGGSTITLDTSDNVTIAGDATIAGDLTISGGNITSALALDSTLSVTGLLTASNLLLASSGVKLGNNIIYASDGGSTITLDTSDNVTILGDLTISGGNITNAITFDSAVTLSSTINGATLGVDSDSVLAQSTGTGTSNTIFGKNAGDSITSGGNYNTLLGENAGTAITTGDGWVIVGTAAGSTIDTMSGGTIIGYLAGADYATSGGTIIGYQAGTYATTAAQCVFIGHQAGFGSDSVAVTGDSNVAIGYTAGSDLAAGEKNTLVGHTSGNDITSGNNNTCVGYKSGFKMTTALDNVAIGMNALRTNVDGDNNVAVGVSALYTFEADTDGHGYNTALGFQAGKFLSTGTFSTFIGTNAGLGITGTPITGDNNTCVGNSAGLELEGAAHSNTLIGANAGNTTEAGFENTIIGYNCETYDDASTNQIVIGNNLTAIDADNAIFIGNDTRQIRCDYGSDQTWDAPSDERIKNITGDSPLGLDFINSIPVKTFKWKSPSEYPKEFNSYDAEQTNPSDILEHHGLIAQTVKAALDKAGVVDFSGWDVDSDGMQTVGESAFVYPLMKAVQELSKKVEELENKE